MDTSCYRCAASISNGSFSAPLNGVESGNTRFPPAQQTAVNGGNPPSPRSFFTSPAPVIALAQMPLTGLEWPALQDGNRLIILASVIQTGLHVQVGSGCHAAKMRIRTMIFRRLLAHSFSSLRASSMRWSASTLVAVAVAWSGFAALPAAAADAAPQAVEIRLWHAAHVACQSGRWQRAREP